MSLLDNLLDVIVPYDCLGCGTEGSPLCLKCLNGLPGVPERCYRCHRASNDYRTCTECQAQTALGAVRPAVVYAGLAKDLIWRLKSSGAQAATAVMAQRMVPLVRPADRTVIVSVPTATGRVRQRGYDQARLLARALARQAHLPWLDCLARSGQAHQVGSGREQRRQQLQAAYRVSQRRFVRGAHIILVDDVVTTGATLEAAALVLQQAGATQIEAITFAQPLLKIKQPTVK